MARLRHIALAGLLLFLLSATPALAGPLTGRPIVLDPGHGGSEPGTTECPTLAEKTATLDVATRVKALLETDGATVHLTRTGDTTRSNRDRYTLANSVEGEALLSIHFNGSTNHAANGTLTLYGKRHKDLEFARVMHSALYPGLGVPDGGIRNFASGVLLKSQMPAVMAETVFLSNTEECAALSDGSGARQQQIAQQLAQGLSAWFSR